ncbi:Transmembrane protein 62 [Actinomortierella wolfii]|nr:Transmembrane protein 62 [Actinomortierella wolfii]
MAKQTRSSIGSAWNVRSILRIVRAFAPLVVLVVSAWSYAVYLDRIATRTMRASNTPGRRSPETTASTSGRKAEEASSHGSTRSDDTVSDLHISTFRKASTANFYTFLSTALPYINPSFVVVTGDLTDAKDKKLVGSTQYVEEWITYQDALEESGVLKKRNGTFWHDLRGNHDCFNVPDWNSDQNMYAMMSATRTPGFMFDVKTEYGKYGFIGIDSCPKPGPARPYNFFGLFETPDMDHLAKRLSLSQGNNHTFVFSHYPVTTTVFGQTSKGESFADLSKSFSVYMCGHLHKLKWGMGDALQSYQPSHFLELEVGDMKQNGIYRIMAVDHDMISFADINMPLTTIPPALNPGPLEPIDDESDSDEPNEHGRKRPKLGPRLASNPVVLVTNPKDSRYMIPHHEPVGRIAKSTHIRFLAWTDNTTSTNTPGRSRRRPDITAEILIDGKVHPNPVKFVGTRREEQTSEKEFLPLYVAEWDPSVYNDGKEHELSIKVMDGNGRVGISKSVFRVDGKRSSLNGGVAEWIMWANIAMLLKTLFTTGYLAVVLIMLVLPKLYSLYLQSCPPSAVMLSERKSDEVASNPLLGSDNAATTIHYNQPGRRHLNGYDAWIEEKSRHLHRLSSTLPSISGQHRLWNRLVNHTIHAHMLRFVHFSTQPILFYTTLIYTLLLVCAPHYWGNFVPAAGEQGQGYFYLQGIYLPNAGGHLGGGLGPGSVDQGQGAAGPLHLIADAIRVLFGRPHVDRNYVEGTWVPMADTWMSTIWTVVYDLVIFLYYLTLCATPAGYLYSPTNAHRLRPFHRTWYVRCLIFGIWIFRCCSVLMTAELYGPSVVWTGISTWWLLIVGWIMFMVGWSRSRNEKDIFLLKEEQEEYEQAIKYDKTPSFMSSNSSSSNNNNNNNNVGTATSTASSVATNTTTTSTTSSTTTTAKLIVVKEGGYRQSEKNDQDHMHHQPHQHHHHHHHLHSQHLSNEYDQTGAKNRGRKPRHQDSV